MNGSDKRMCAIYLVIAVVALFGTWSQNLAFMAEPGHGDALTFIRACFANHAAASIAIDLLLLGVAVFVFMGIEAKKHRMRFYWLYVVASLGIAISVVFPVFMAVRQWHLAKEREASPSI